jgi:hypothetical protein
MLAACCGFGIHGCVHHAPPVYYYLTCTDTNCLELRAGVAHSYFMNQSEVIK